MTGVVALLLVAGIGGQCVRSHYHNARTRRDVHAKAQALKDEIDRRFPTGTDRAEFQPFAEAWSGWHAESGNDQFLSVGQVPSDVWYCGPWDVVVVVRFKDKRLTGTQISQIGLNCL